MIKRIIEKETFAQTPAHDNFPVISDSLDKLRCAVLEILIPHLATRCRDSGFCTPCASKLTCSAVCAFYDP